MRLGLLLVLLAHTAVPLMARRQPASCGTDRETSDERLFLHRRAVRARPRALAIPAATGNRDIGNIAVLDDSGGVVARQNEFNLDLQTLQFLPQNPSATRYRYAVGGQNYDAVAASNATPLAALDDDDSRLIPLPFAFPFFGATYRQLYVNSDGNLTFTIAENASTARSLGRMTSGPPRIAPLFADLDPSQTAGGVRVLADSTRVVISWIAVPEYVGSGLGRAQTFQVRLYPDGRIEFSYSGISTASAVVGIAPGAAAGATTILDFRDDSSAEYTAAVAERFGNTLEVDVVSVAQKFYRTHDDAYDYLVIYNNMGIPAEPGTNVIAFENTVRSSGTGYAVAPRDDGATYDSPSRLLSVLQMANLDQYPVDPAGIVSGRTDTPITTIAHEAGHLFLAFASIPDPAGSASLPMLGYQNAHWAFVFNSDASLLEGERIVDLGAGISPRFVTGGTVEHYSALDQYLMGFLPPTQVPDTFVVQGNSTAFAQKHPASGVKFDGTRLNIGIDDVVAAAGRRTPDSTVAQRRFRFAFILLVPQGADPSAADLARVDTYRSRFESFYAQAASQNATADTSLRRSVRLSLFPAAGVVAGAAVSASLTLASPAASDLTVQLQAPNGFAKLPSSVTVAKGADHVSFTVEGVKAGVEEIAAAPADPAYETAFARLQVAAASLLQLAPVSGDRQISTSASPLPDPVIVRLTDANRLAYPGARVVAAPSAGGSVSPLVAVTDAQGQAAFRWTPGAASVNQLQLSVEAAPAVSLTVRAGGAVPVITAVVNAASFESGMAAGAFETVGGVNLAGGRILLDGTPLPITYTSDTQINFYVPAETRLGPATLTIATPSGAQAAAPVNVVAVQPGIFAGAILHAGTTQSAVNFPVTAGDYLEIYCTGLGPTALGLTTATPKVFIGAAPAAVLYSGLTAVPGLYQVNVRVPSGLAPGPQSLLLSLNTAHSNAVQIVLQ